MKPAFLTRANSAMKLGPAKAVICILHTEPAAGFAGCNQRYFLKTLVLGETPQKSGRRGHAPIGIQRATERFKDIDRTSL
jgi:hypothetical protein